MTPVIEKLKTEQATLREAVMNASRLKKELIDRLESITAEISEMDLQLEHLDIAIEAIEGRVIFKAGCPECGGSFIGGGGGAGIKSFSICENGHKREME